MTSPAPQIDDQTRGRQQVMLGVGLVMGACVIGGLTAIVLAVIGLRTPGMIVGVCAGAVIVAGIAIQMKGVRLLKAGAGKVRS